MLDTLTPALDALQLWDRAAFVAVNSAWTSGALDWIMPLITNLNKSRLVVAVLLPLMLTFWTWCSGRAAIKIIVALLIAGGLSDSISYRVIKELVQRPRPDPVVLRVDPAGGPSFPSNHAANTFAEATLLWLALRRWSWLAFLYAAAVAYSRVYVGVHYPLDVLAGAGVGAVCGWVAWLAMRNWIRSASWAWVSPLVSNANL